MTGPADPAAARREAEEALKAHDVAVAGDEWAFAPISLDVADALRDLLAEPQEPVPDAVVRECGGRCHDALDSRSPCPACAADLSAPDAVVREALRASAPDAVREAAEALRARMREIYADRRYKNVWATAQEYLGPYTGPNCIAEAEALDAALDAAKGGKP